MGNEKAVFEADQAAFRWSWPETIPGVLVQYRRPDPHRAQQGESDCFHRDLEAARFLMGPLARHQYQFGDSYDIVDNDPAAAELSGQLDGYRMVLSVTRPPSDQGGPKEAYRRDSTMASEIERFIVGSGKEDANRLFSELTRYHVSICTNVLGRDHPSRALDFNGRVTRADGLAAFKRPGMTWSGATATENSSVGYIAYREIGAFGKRQLCVWGMTASDGVRFCYLLAHDLKGVIDSLFQPGIGHRDCLIAVEMTRPDEVLSSGLWKPCFDRVRVVVDRRRTVTQSEDETVDYGEWGDGPALEIDLTGINMPG